MAVVVISVSGFNKSAPEVFAAPIVTEVDVGINEVTNSSIKQVVAKENSIELPPMGVLGDIKPASTSVDYDDVKRTFDSGKIKEIMNSALARVNAGSEVNLGSELTTTELKEYKDLVDTYNDKIYRAGTKSLSESDIKNLLGEFEAWCTKHKRTKVVEVNLLDETVKLQPPSLKEQYLTYMPYTAVTAKGSQQYKLRELAKSTEDGYRVYDGATLVALASYYGTEIGSIYNIHFDDGKIMKAILGDAKSDLHTDSTHRYRDSSEKYDGSSGNIVEIIFDTSLYSNLGDQDKMLKVNKKINSDYPGRVVLIEKVGKAKDF